MNIDKKRTSVFRRVRTLLPVALGIEILCISAAVIGENVSFVIFGYNLQGIILGFVFGYLAAGFATLLTILGRYELNVKIDSCCSILEQESRNGFKSSLVTTFENFASGIAKFPNLYRHPDLKQILRTSLVILVTAESSCILIAETINLLLYQYSIILSVPLALLGGSFTIVALEIFKRPKNSSGNPKPSWR